MSKLGIVRAAALSLALAVATPAFAAELHGVHGGDLIDVAGSTKLTQVSARSHRATLLRPIAPSVGRTTTRRPGSIWATMVCGVRAYKTKKERLRPLFFVLDTFHARQSAGVIENSRLHILRAAFVLAMERERV